MLQTHGGFKIGTNQFALVKKTEEQSARLMKYGDHKLAKELLESVLKKHEFEEPTLFMLTGQVNLKLGYLVLAEQMFYKAAEFAGFEAKAHAQLGVIAQAQNNIQQALEHFKHSLSIENDWQVSYQAGYLLLNVACDHKQAVEYLTNAIDQASKNALRIDPACLADMYVCRMRCYKGLGLTEHARMDYQKVLNADPNFIRREMAAKEAHK
jgi:tetratricopeptide (TPR) repeat protein